jgi:hypothetical protein
VYSAREPGKSLVAGEPVPVCINAYSLAHVFDADRDTMHFANAIVGVHAVAESNGQQSVET